MVQDYVIEAAARAAHKASRSCDESILRWEQLSPDQRAGAIVRVQRVLDPLPGDELRVALRSKSARANAFAMAAVATAEALGWRRVT